jgi:hypothetical protein
VIGACNLAARGSGVEATAAMKIEPQEPYRLAADVPAADRIVRLREASAGELEQYGVGVGHLRHV